MNPLVTLQEVKEFLTIKTTSTEDDPKLSNIILQVSSLVTSYCGRQFDLSNSVEYFDGGTASVFVRNIPIQRINEVSNYNGTDYSILGSPGTLGQPIAVEGSAHAPTIIGNSSLNTRVKKLNKSSIKLDGNSHVEAPASEEWNLGEADFTVESFVRLSANTGNVFAISNNWVLSINNTSPVLTAYDGSSTVLNLSNNEVLLTLNKFYHVAAVKKDSNVTLYLDGNTVATTDTFYSVIPYNNSVLKIGSNLTGYLDNFRISHIAEYTDEFTTSDYSFPATENTKLLLRFDGANNSTTIVDSSRTVNEYAFYTDTGEISFDVGHGGGNPSLGFNNITTSSNYPRGVKIDYLGGFYEIPYDLKLAILEMIKIIHKGRSGTERASFAGDSSQAFVLSSDDFPPQVRRVLNLYKLVV